MIKVWHVDLEPSCFEEYTMVFDPSSTDIEFAESGDPYGPWVTTTGKGRTLILRKHYCPGPIRGGRQLFKVKCSEGL
jgi:hypothetical protein